MITKYFLTILFVSSVYWFPLSVQAAQTGATIKVNGMVCSFCSTSIEKKFKEFSEIAEVTVDLETKNVILKYAPNKELTEAQIKETITKSGYTVVSIAYAKDGK